MMTTRTTLAGIGYVLAFAAGMLVTAPALAQPDHQQPAAPCAAKTTQATGMHDPAPAAESAPIPWDLLKGGP